MEELSMDSLYQTYYRKVQHVPTTFKRYLYNKINWSNRVIGIIGERGVGKTTLILQHIKETFPHREDALYVSLDNMWFSTHSLMDLVEYFYTHGGRHIFLDEVHKYPNWQTVLKNLCDDYDDLYITYTSSSMLLMDRQKGDMSRRQITYKLYGMSFREYLEFEGLATVGPISIAELLGNHVDIANSITGQGFSILPAFEQYLRHGYYPFYKAEADGFESRLQEVVNQVLESDLPAVTEVSFSTIIKARKLLMLIAEKVPFIPKMSELYAELETTRDLGLKLIHTLNKAGLLNLVTYEPKNLHILSRPDKILLGNSCLMYSLTHKCEIGTIRETFFCNQVSAVYDLLLAKLGDFQVERKYIFEVGGKYKTFDQIKDLANSYLAKDSIEIGQGNSIPLWMFGLLY